MFYSNQILARKGPLGLVWIAAHLDRQLKRQQINSTSIPASVDTLLDSEVPLALRLSGQLLLGVVRIYARKVGYLQQDCNDALVKIKVAIRPADGVNLPPDATTAPVEHITLLAPGRGRGRKAAAAAAASLEAAHGVDGFVVDMEDFYWDQDVLLGQDGGGFTGFDINGGFELGLAPSTSGPLSQDISGVFGMHSSSADFNQEVFDVEDEEAAAVWDLDELEVERLRAAASQQQHSSGVSGLLGLTPGAVEGPAGKGGAVAPESPDDSDEPLRPRRHLDDDLASPAAAAPGGEDMMPEDGLDFRQDSNAADDLPPTPADGLLSQDFEGDGAAGYTGGTAGAGHTPGSVSKLLPPTPHLDLAPAGEESGAAAVAGDDVDMMDVDGPVGASEQEHGVGEQQQGAAAAEASTPTKTFQRRKASQHQEEQEQQQEPAETSAAAATKAARQRRTAALLGHKKRVTIDDYPAEGGAAGGSATKRNAAAAAATRRQPPTELPAAEIRALLADRSPLMDKKRGQSLLGKRLQPEPLQAAAAAAAAPTAAELLQLVPAADGGGSRDTRAALAALLGGNSSSQGSGSSAAAAAAVVSGSLGRGLLGQSSSGFGGVVGVIGGLGAARLPPQIQQLFVQAAHAAGAAKGGAAALAPTAALDQIDMAAGHEDDVAAAAGGLTAGGLNPRGATRNSLSLSFSTPGSAAAAASTPATDGQQQGSGATGGPATGLSAGDAGLTPGYGDGYTPGSVAAGQGQAGPDSAAEQQQHVDEGMYMHDDEMMDVGLQLDMGQHEQQEFEEPQPEDVRAAGAPGGSSFFGSQEGLVPWPADAETLTEQPADGADGVNDGGFTSRTRLVMRHLQRAAAAAAGPSSAATPASGSRRRISAAPPPALAAAASGVKDVDQEDGAAAGGSGTTLSFNALTQGHKRLDACRWFYEVLVLGNKGLVKVKQDEPYGDIAITTNLAAMARM